MVLDAEPGRQFVLGLDAIGVKPLDAAADPVRAEHADVLARAVIGHEVPMAVGKADAVRLDRPPLQPVVADGVIGELHRPAMEHRRGQLAQVRLLLRVGAGGLRACSPAKEGWKRKCSSAVSRISPGIGESNWSFRSAERSASDTGPAAPASRKRPASARMAASEGVS